MAFLEIPADACNSQKTHFRQIETYAVFARDGSPGVRHTHYAARLRQEFMVCPASYKFNPTICRGLSEKGNHFPKANHKTTLSREEQSRCEVLWLGRLRRLCPCFCIPLKCRCFSTQISTLASYWKCCSQLADSCHPDDGDDTSLRNVGSYKSHMA
jgi:hypothetical protein